MSGDTSREAVVKSESICMPTSSSTRGIAGIVIGMFAVNAIITLTTGAYVNWVLCCSASSSV